MGVGTLERQKLATSAAAVEKARYVGRAGMVTVTLNGLHEAVEVKIDPKVFQSGDPAVLERCVLGAINHAVGQVTRAFTEQVKEVVELLGMDPAAWESLRASPPASAQRSGAHPRRPAAMGAEASQGAAAPSAQQAAVVAKPSSAPGGPSPHGSGIKK